METIKLEVKTNAVQGGDAVELHLCLARWRFVLFVLLLGARSLLCKPVALPSFPKGFGSGTKWKSWLACTLYWIENFSSRVAEVLTCKKKHKSRETFFELPFLRLPLTSSIQGNKDRNTLRIATVGFVLIWSSKCTILHQVNSSDEMFNHYCDRTVCYKIVPQQQRA